MRYTADLLAQRNDLSRTVDALRQQLAEANRGCPCAVVEPCSPHCSCAHPHMSRGCQRCARYGSAEQRLAMAQHLAGLHQQLREVTEERDRLLPQVDVLLRAVQESDAKRDAALADVERLKGEVERRDAAAASIRDSVLHGRHQLAEMEIDSDITNAVLGIIDDEWGQFDAAMQEGRDACTAKEREAE